MILVQARSPSPRMATLHAAIVRHGWRRPASCAPLAVWTTWLSAAPLLCICPPTPTPLVVHWCGSMQPHAACNARYGFACIVLPTRSPIVRLGTCTCTLGALALLAPCAHSVRAHPASTCPIHEHCTALLSAACSISNNVINKNAPGQGGGQCLCPSPCYAHAA